MQLHLYPTPQPDRLSSPPVRTQDDGATPIAADWLAQHLQSGAAPGPLQRLPLVGRTLSLALLRSALPSLKQAMHDPTQAAVRDERAVRIELSPGHEGADIDLSIPLAMLARDIATVSSLFGEATDITVES